MFFNTWNQCHTTSVLDRHLFRYTPIEKTFHASPLPFSSVLRAREICAMQVRDRGCFYIYPVATRNKRSQGLCIVPNTTQKSLATRYISIATILGAGEWLELYFQYSFQYINGLDVNVAVDCPVVLPPNDHVPWSLCQGDVPSANWLVCMTCRPGVFGLKPV